MISCPQCGKQVKGDFGMISCPSCRAVFFVDMDGQVNAYKEEPQEEPPPGGFEPAAIPDEPNVVVPQNSIAPQVDLPPVAVPNVVAESSETSLPVQSDSVGIAEFSDIAETEEQSSEQDSSLDVLPMESFSPDKEEELVQEEENSSSEMSLQPDEVQDISSSFDFSDLGTNASELPNEQISENVISSTEKQNSSQNPNDVFSEITDFANSENSQAKNGVLQFSITIQGIDSAELRKSVLDMLDDRRFLWNVQEIEDSIKDGKIELKNLSPVKASLVVNRLKGLSVDITWEQSLVTEVDVNEQVENVQ